MAGDGSKWRQQFRADQNEYTERNPDAWYVKHIQKFGEERNLDLDQVIAAHQALNHDITLVRWRSDPEVKEAIREAREAIDNLHNLLMARFWEVEPLDSPHERE